MKYWCAILCLILVGGCAPKPSAELKTKQNLMILGLEYHNVSAGGIIPQTPEQLAEHSSDAKIALSDGSCVILCGLNLKESDPPASEIIIGYHKDTPEQGGYALYGDGRVALMSKAEFAGAKKFTPEKKSE